MRQETRDVKRQIRPRPARCLIPIDRFPASRAYQDATTMLFFTISTWLVDEL